jgi:4-hydroxy-tetrahydrodipicolinate synthase
MRFDGIYTPIVTPHRDDFSIDRDALTDVIEHLLAAGVHGIILAGTTGEYYAQTREERIELMHRARDLVGDRLPLVIGTAALRTEDAARYAEAARAAGADAILLGSPYYAVPTERELALHCLEVERAANLPVMLYNFPSRTGVMMGDEFLDRVGRNPNFCAIKESSGDINRLHALARDYAHIQACCGMDDQALEYFAWGARAWVCAGSNFLPEEHIALYRACVVDGDFTRGRRIMSAMLPLMRTLEQGGKFLQCIKHGVRHAGLPAGPVRRPLRELTKDDARALETTIRTLRTSIRQIERTPETTERRAGHVRTAHA